MSDEAHVRRQFERAIELRDQGKPAGAVDLLRQELSGELTRRQRAAVTGFLAGLVLYDLQNPVQAEPLCRASVSLSPRSEQASIDLFHSLWDLRRPISALEEMRRFVATVGISKEYEQLAVEISSTLGDPDAGRQGILAFALGRPEAEWRSALHSIEVAFAQKCRK